ncbi:MAG: hypothetical protein H6607_09470 [Flavobacteriales bacterium]|nr:hypothetical protein [Flavobacteriales bacterium]
MKTIIYLFIFCLTLSCASNNQKMKDETSNNEIIKVKPKVKQEGDFLFTKGKKKTEEDINLIIDKSGFNCSQFKGKYAVFKLYIDTSGNFTNIRLSGESINNQSILRSFEEYIVDQGTYNIAFLVDAELYIQEYLVYINFFNNCSEVTVSYDFGG